MFATVPVYQATGTTQETQLIQPALIRHIAPHADVTVDSVPTPCCEAFFSESDSLIILLDVPTMKTRLVSLTGIIDDFGNISDDL